MKVYLGQTRSRKLIRELDAYGFGEMTVRGQEPVRRPFALDNGAFTDWKAGTQFDAPAYEKTVRAFVDQGLVPDFAVVPDVVAGGIESLVRSIEWLPRMPEHWPRYLAVQDGMSNAVVTEALDINPFAGVFVGGSLAWKLETGGAWVRLAHARGLPCHIGRVGTPGRVRWARNVGADSIDSCLPLWSKDNLQRFLLALGIDPLPTRNLNTAVHFGSASDEWATPQAFFAAQHARWNFTLDVCATSESAKCPAFFTREQDGLAQEWTGICWMNPPYGRGIGAWVKKAAQSAAAGAIVVALLPSRTDTAWWHDWVQPYGVVEFIRGRLKFGGAKNSAPFPSALVIFRRKG